MISAVNGGVGYRVPDKVAEPRSDGFRGRAQGWWPLLDVLEALDVVLARGSDAADKFFASGASGAGNRHIGVTLSYELVDGTGGRIAGIESVPARFPTRPPSL
jgi:hypothetical protein